MCFEGTLASHRNGVAAGRVFLEALLSSLDDFVESADIDLPVLFAKIRVDNGIELPEDLAQFGVEVVLDAVVSPTSKQLYLPGICAAISDHLFPI